MKFPVKILTQNPNVTFRRLKQMQIICNAFNERQEKDYRKLIYLSLAYCFQQFQNAENPADN